MAGAVGVLAVVLAHAEPPLTQHHHGNGHADGPRWGLRAPAEGFYAAGGYRLVGGELRVPPQSAASYGNPPQRGGSIRDAVTRYSEERGGYVGQQRPAPRENPPPEAMPDMRRH